jgi:hypothetical protein
MTLRISVQPVEVDQIRPSEVTVVSHTAVTRLGCRRVLDPQLLSEMDDSAKARRLLVSEHMQTPEG